ncbi:sensor domain-containing diguanylate cyclase [Anaerocolumna sp.]|uniref:sensor domain-containing diguanylate cyclase n=1 Tax=Anaerocolumna sp. TaxID=2041569 RepID=UPI0028A74AB8|nr:sensor domain-containing diguanylate cyclase [Anaerocolumna sp.]
MNRYEKMRRKLYETSDRISKTNDENEIYSIVLDTIIELIPNATNGSVLLINEDGDFNFKVVKGFQKELKRISLKRDETYLYRINRFEKTAIINNPEEFDRKHASKDTIEGFERLNALDISCTISAPIYIDNKLIGLINVDSNKTNHIFTQKDLDLMDQIKCELELAIKNALAQNKLKYLANYDELTGVMNRRTLKKEYDNEIAKMKYNRKSMTLIMIDVDNFKCFNDTYGHFFGDMVLKHFSEVLSNSVGASDIVARFAGDEFIILLKGLDLAGAENKMKSIEERLLSEKLDGIILKFSYGICEIGPDANMNFEKALTLADEKMYEYKKREVCDQEMQEI